ncbi:MAG: hypothetical protein UY67_C0019G0008 [Candidatus Kaiserbacteria bacterium GW2011_GWA2_52_12]|uniref:Peptidase S74 domain-containing protein n=1 Tax=Candidatus Kaiserbacteria bacterium GW2011_GWA2_52_12 TaxID=1618671 RepID=A0A0G1WXR8_9BACT|nr:MAG: hypothetical protein UY67_C0019G0008 [Candidatus Kaiserbacteria bacterium GW2011_GWA2_52_12]
MKQKLFGVPLYYFSVAMLGATIVLVGYSVYAWTGPTQSPPGGNVSPPINTGSGGQVKSGDFATLGKLGVGTVTPGVPLDVVGNVRSSTGFCIGASCVTSWSTGSLSGSGSTNYIPRWTGATSLGNSSITSDGSSATSLGNFFVPFIYDSNNTGYYVDPNSMSNMERVDFSYGYDRNNTGYYIDLDNRTNLLNLTASGDVRAAIFYDQNNTGYYVDPSSMSNMERVDFSYGYDRNNTGYYIDLNNGTNLNYATANDWYANSWFRVNGGGGIYWQAYGGGWYMQDSTWIRSYNGKYLYISAGLDTGGASGIACGGGLGGGYTFRVCGTAYVTSNLYAAAFIYASDERLKEDIVPISDSLLKLGKITGVSFTWKEGTPRAGQHDIGVIAQDVEKVVPEAVTTDANGMKAVDYPRLIPLLINAVNEQQKEIDGLKAEIEALKAR